MVGAANHTDTGIQERDICREPIRILLSFFRFIFKLSSTLTRATTDQDIEEITLSFSFLRFYNVFFVACGLWSSALLHSIMLHHYTDTDTDGCGNAGLGQRLVSTNGWL